MELKRDLNEREEQVDSVLDNPECTAQDVVQLYDAWHETYDQDMTTWGYHLDKHLNAFEDFVKIRKDSRILDVAAGTGLVGQKLRERGYTNLDALDGSKGMLQQAKAKGVYRNYIHAWLGPEPIEDVENDTYDTLICVGALDTTHINQTCFESLAAITKPGGYIYFVGVLEWLHERQEFEDEMKRMQDEGTWKWVLMKETEDKYDKDGPAVYYAFEILK